MNKIIPDKIAIGIILIIVIISDLLLWQRMDKDINNLIVFINNNSTQQNTPNAAYQDYKLVQVRNLETEFIFEVPEKWLTETRRPEKQLNASEIREFLALDPKVIQKSYSSDYFNLPKEELEKMSNEEVIASYNSVGDEFRPFPIGSVADGDHIWYHDTSWNQIDFYILRNFDDLKTSYYNDMYYNRSDSIGIWSKEKVSGKDADVITYKTDKDEEGNELISKAGAGGKVYFIRMNNSQDMLIIDKQAKGNDQFEKDFVRLIQSLKIN